MSATMLRGREAGDPNASLPAAAPHVLNSAVEHPSWCEWTGLVPLVESLTGPGYYRCPGCWGGPSDAS